MDRNNFSNSILGEQAFELKLTLGGFIVNEKLS